MKFWHMQMHPTGEIRFSKNIDWILEHKKIIGLGQWKEGQDQLTNLLTILRLMMLSL